ncbi:hypothetical protein CDA09_15615 [Azoarcus sp. DN11]|nr:hypothetical protein CDA09_15615 [Azoarcus sp. DN11]
MQVDFRSRYTMSEQGATDTRYVRQLTSFEQFFSGNEIGIVKNYAAAKVEVRNWLEGAGAATIYSRLERIRNGESFDAVITR